jgi:hypothetical protein
MQAILQNPFLKYLYGFFPKLTTVIFGAICFTVGMVFAYATIAFVDGSPVQLEQTWQDQWIISTEARFRNANSQADQERGNIISLLAAVDNPQEIVQRLQLGDANFQQLVQEAQPLAPPTPRTGTIVTNYVFPALWVVAFTVGYVALFFVWSFIVWPFIRDLTRQEDEEEKAAAAAQIQKIKDVKAAEVEMKKQAASSEGSQKYGSPVIQKISQYRAGFGNYDDSFNIETEDKVYFGEAGGSIAEKIGEAGVTAIEIWMFDKDEFTNTPNSILASEYAFNDAGLRSRLEPKGEVVLAEPGKLIKLETNALYVEAKVSNVTYKQGTAIPDSEFEMVEVQITAWAKNVDTGGSAMPDPTAPPSPAGFPPMPDTAPTQPASPVGSGYQPPAPPTPSGPPPPDPFGGSSQPPNDPFGGTGDFTPVNPDK